MTSGDVRKRRAERAKKARLKDAPKRLAKYGIVGLAVAGVVAAGAYVALNAPPSNLFAHEHPVFAMFINDERILFNDPAYDAANLFGKVHFHVREQPDGGATLHVEGQFRGGLPDVALAEVFEFYGVTLRKGFLRLDSLDGHNGSSYADDANRTLQVYWAKLLPGGTYENRTQLDGDYSKFVPRHGNRVLVSYGTQEPAEIARQWAAIPQISAGNLGEDVSPEDQNPYPKGN